MSDRAEAVRATGGCLCGAVRYEVRGPLRDVVLCHCSHCRRTHGHVAAYAACAGSDLVVTDSGTLRWYADGDRERGFCAACGASLFWRAAGRDTVSVAAGTIDPPTGLRTVGQIFVASAGDYYEAGGEGERFADALPPGWPGDTPPIPPQRLAVAADAPAIAALMRASVLDAVPRLLRRAPDGQRRRATSPTSTCTLIEDGTYFVHTAGGEIVACGGWSRRNKLYTGSGGGRRRRASARSGDRARAGARDVRPRRLDAARPRPGDPRRRASARRGSRASGSSCSARRCRASRCTARSGSRRSSGSR